MATASRLTTYHLPVATVYAGDLDITGGSLDLNNQGGVINVGAVGNDWSATIFSVVNSNTGAKIIVRAQNLDNTNTASHGVLEAASGGSSGGDPQVIFRVIADGQVVTMGLDNTVSDNFTISDNDGLGTNDRLRLVTSTGVLSVDGAGAGDGLPTLFDEYDDTKELRTFQMANVDSSLVTKEQQITNQQRLVEIGVAEWAIQEDGSYHWMIKIQPMLRLLAGGVFQNRQLIEQRLTGLEAGGG